MLSLSIFLMLLSLVLIRNERTCMAEHVSRFIWADVLFLFHSYKCPKRCCKLEKKAKKRCESYIAVSLFLPPISLSLSLVIFPNDYTVLYIIAVWRLPWILLSSTHPTNTHLYSTAFSNNYYKWMIILLAFCDTPQQQQEGGGGGHLFFKWKNFKFENY